MNFTQLRSRVLLERSAGESPERGLLYILQRCFLSVSFYPYLVAWWLNQQVNTALQETVALDNRGVGQSDVPPGTYSIALMASDAASVKGAMRQLRKRRARKYHLIGLNRRA